MESFGADISRKRGPTYGARRPTAHDGIKLLAIASGRRTMPHVRSGDRACPVKPDPSSRPLLCCRHWRVSTIWRRGRFGGLRKGIVRSAESVAAGVSIRGRSDHPLTGVRRCRRANKNLTYELLTLRRAIERDRLG